MIEKNQKRGRKIGKATVRSMLSLSHFKFKQRLLHMAKSRDCIVNICDESYTTKTCGICGNLNNFVGPSKVFKCPKCDITIDRDYNGARNIYLKNVQDLRTVESP